MCSGRRSTSLLAASDVVSLHVPLTDETRNLIDADAIARMKPDAILINAARGGVVDEAALAAALRDGRLGGAALDVFETSRCPPRAGAVFRDVPNLILTPHIAGVTVESNVRVSWLTAETVPPPSGWRAMSDARLSIAEAEALVARRRCSAAGTSTANARSVARALVAAEADGQKGHGLSRVPTYAAQAKAGKVDGDADHRRAPRHGPACSRSTPAHGFAYPALDLARGDAARAWRARQGIAAAGDPPLAPLRRRRPSGRAAGAARAGRACCSPTRPARWRPWGGAPRAVRHQSDRLRLSRSEGRSADRRRPVAVEGRARQDPGGQAERRADPGRLGARRRRPPDHRPRRRRSPAPWCRSATPRAPRWR